MEVIAAELGVSQRQISTDLRDLEVTSNSPRARTATNPRGAGRSFAEQLGVGFSTIQRDLGNLPTTGNSPRARTATLLIV